MKNSAVETIQQAAPEAMVPSSWGYGTFHQNNPVYINMVRTQLQEPQQSHKVNPKIYITTL